MKLSVIIPTRDRAASLMRTLDALAAQDGAPEFEVIVVDNGSSDATQHELAQRADPFALVSLHEAVPNRARARNAGIAAATGTIAVFIDDDVVVPQRFLAAHAAAHVGIAPRTVAGPILNVPSLERQPKPTWRNVSRAFFCTCNASVPLASLRLAGGFDERFDRYGWEDTELGVRLRESGVRRFFAWDAYVYHLKPPGWESLEAASRRAIEKARMADAFVRKQPQLRVRLATGNYRANRLRAAVVAPEWLLALAAGVAADERLPRGLRGAARAHYLDGLYVNELRRRAHVS